MGIYAKVNGEWKSVDGGDAGLEGLGGWAEITDVSGSPKRYAYPDGDTDWVAFEWTGDGSLTTQAGGLVEALVVGGGSWNANISRTAGRVVAGVEKVNTSNSIQVGIGGKQTIPPSTSKIGPITVGGVDWSGAAFRVFGAADGESGVVSTITGVQKEYATANGTTPGSCSATNGVNGQPGVVIVRVPAAQAEKVSSDKWVTRSNHFAFVENGVVTETYTEHHYGNGTITPLPQTDLIPCDANVTEGYAYENGEFVAPAPDPTAVEELVAELQAQIDTLRKK